MTINVQTGISGVMLGDGSNPVFPFDFQVASIGEIVAYIDGAAVSPADFTVDLSDNWTGDVVFDEAPADGAEVVLASDPLFAQTSVHLRQGPFSPDVVEDDLDRATLREIYLKRRVDRAFALPEVNPEAHAGKFPVVLPGGTPGFSSGTGADAGLRTDLADPEVGPALLGTPYGSAGDVFDILFNRRLYVSQYATPAAAFAAWVVKGGELMIDEDVAFSAATQIALQAGKDYVLTSDRARQVLFTGPAYTNGDFNYLLQLYMDPTAKLTVEGDITFDADNKVANALWVFPLLAVGASRRPLRIAGVTCENAKMLVVGTGGSNGLRVSGGVSDLRLEDVTVRNIGRAAGVVALGTQGSVGIAVSGAIRSTIIDNVTVDDVTSDDPVASDSFFDMDGVSLFPQAEIGGKSPIVRNSRFINCRGRSIKMFAPQGGGIAEKISILRDQRSAKGGFVDIDFQHGDGIIRNVDMTYSGASIVVGQQATPFSMVGAFSVESPRQTPWEIAVVENVRITDTTGVPKYTLVNIPYSLNDGSSVRRLVMRNIVDTGTAQVLWQPGALGSLFPLSVDIENIDVNLTVALGRTSDEMDFLTVRARHLTNRSASKPVMVFTNDAVKSIRWGHHIGDATVKGINGYYGVWRGNPTFSNGFTGPGIGVEATPRAGTCEVSGRVVLPAKLIADGDTAAWPATGLYQNIGGDYEVQMRRLEPLFGGGRWRTDPSSTTWSVLDAPSAGVSAVNGGAPSGSGSALELWKDAATQEPRVTNYTGSAVLVQLVLNP